MEARDNIARALRLIRAHLDMDVAFISEFMGDWRYMHFVDLRRPDRDPISVGDQILLQDGYCRHIVEGRIPELVADTADVPEAMAIPDTIAMPIGAHMSVPLHLADGRVFGTFCCFNFTARPDLRARDLVALRMVADQVAKKIDNNGYQLPFSEIEALLLKSRES
ncbi:MAG: hypothetical protein A4S14_17530 [Proteobacteria bacterium SG_bin9]|nr:MAG: hypothetical protein A4S14_17530 [Proteobacteria bacterium SG_bin9]